MTAPLPLPDDPRTLEPVDWRAREAEFDPVSHIGYRESNRAFCGAVFAYHSRVRPTDRRICAVCDEIRESLGLPK